MIGLILLVLAGVTFGVDVWHYWGTWAVALPLGLLLWVLSVLFAGVGPTVSFQRKAPPA